MEKQLYQWLTTKTSITNIVGSRIYPHWIPQTNNTWPVLTITLLDLDIPYHLTGQADKATALFQLDSWGKTLASVVALSDAIRTELSAFSGTMDDKTVHFVYLDSELALHESPKDGSDNAIYRKMQRYKIKFTP